MAHLSSMATRIVTEVAAHEGVDPVDLSPPLHDAIDPEQLDRLFSSTDGYLKLEFYYDGYWIVAESTGAVEITERATAADGSGDSESQPPIDE